MNNSYHNVQNLFHSLCPQFGRVYDLIPPYIVDKIPQHYIHKFFLFNQ